MTTLLLRCAGLLLLALASLFTPRDAAAQAAPASCPAAAPVLDGPRLAQLKVRARDRGLLWKIEKDGRASWLYGTIHVARADWVVPGPTIAQALLASDVVAVELDLMDPAELAVLLRPADPAATARVLDAARSERIQRLATRGCLPPALLQQQRPLLQAVSLYIAEGRREGLYAEFAVDAVVIGMAHAAGKRLVALEKADQQMAVLAPASEDDERELVDKTLKGMESGEGRRQLRLLAEMWSTGDESALGDYALWCDCMETPAERRFLARLNDERNPAMADKLAALHAQGGSVFAAVGYLHMTGPQSLLQLMRARGFTVQRVNFPTTPARRTP